MQTLAPRPSEASKKAHERSEFIVAFAFLNPCPVFANNCPTTEQSEVKNTSEAST